jgi:hypothetical protein
VITLGAIVTFLVFGWIGSLLCGAIGWSRLAGFLVGGFFPVVGDFILFLIWVFKSL